MCKDLHLVAQSAYEADVPLVATNTVKEVYPGANPAGCAIRTFQPFINI
jgi:3-hydroxyisobutyrate dehydrogenase-like beta-hydroxyacid dehydrogenase